MAGCSQYAAAFGYDIFVIPVSACGIDLSTVSNGLQAGGFFDPSAVLADTTKIREGASPGEILAGEDPGVNIVYDGDTVTTESVFRVKGVTNAGLETDTGTESVITYDTEGRGFDQAVAISKSWSISLEAISTFGDAAYKALRLMEQNAVSGQLKCKIGRVGPVSTTEAIYGYATVTNFSESVEAGGIVNWSAELQGYGPLGLDLDNQNTINIVGPINTLGIFAAGSGLKDGTYPDVSLTGGNGNGLATADITVVGGLVTDVQLVEAGDLYQPLDDLGADLTGADVEGVIDTISISSAGFGIADDAPAESYQNLALDGGSGQGGSVDITVSGGVVTAVAINSAGSGYLASETVTTVSEMPGVPNPTFGEVLTLTNLVVGAGYENTTYTGVAATGGSGQDLTFDITVTNNEVSLVAINVGGTGYVAGETVSATLNPQQLTTGTGEILTLDAASLVGGADYVDAVYPGVALTGGSGSSATADIEVSGGAVIAVTLTAGGTSYVAGETLSALDADLGNSGIGAGFSIDVATVDEDTYATPTAWSVDIETVDEVETLTATKPVFSIDTVATGEGAHTDPTIRVTSIVDNDLSDP